MQTNELIARLSRNLEPVKKGTTTRLLLGAAAVGLAGSVLVMLAALGLRRDFATAMTSFGMWMKLAYTFCVAVLAFGLVARAGRPGADVARSGAMLVFPVLAIAGVAGLEINAPGANASLLVLGHSSRVCAFLVALTALPVLVATFWALRRLAPTQLTLAGTAAGLFAGAAGAFVYCFHCTEGAAPFVGLWYSLGILLTAALGGLLGRSLLRW